MTLTKAQIIDSIQNQTGFPKNKSSEIVETLLEIIKNALSSGEDVLISSFENFVFVKNESGKAGIRQPVIP
jgi:integration host factor subunit alpha